MAFSLMTLLILVASSGGLETSEDYRITPLKHNSGLYFENLQPLRLYNSLWNFVTSVEIKTYLTHRPQVETHLHNANHLCQVANRSHCPSQEVGPRLLKAMEESKKYSDMLEASISGLASGKNKRNADKRKAPLGFVGSLQHLLFGTLDEEDAEYYDTELNNLYSRQAELSELVANQTYIIRSEFDKLHSQQVKVSQGTINLYASAAKMIQNLQDRQEELEFEGTMHAWMDELEREIQEYKSNLITIVDALFFAKQGMLHPVIISPRQLLDAARKLEETTKLEFPLSPAELLSGQINHIATIRSKYTKGRIILEIKIPLLRPTVYSLFKVHPCPSAQKYGKKEVTAYISPASPYIAISEDKEEYFLLDDDYLRESFTHHGQFIGQATLPIQQIEEQPTCEIGLLLDPTRDPWEYCDIKITITKKMHWQRLQSRKAWLYYSLDKKRIQIYCKGHAVGSEYVQDANIIYIKPGCTASVDNTRLASLETFETTGNYTYSPMVSINISAIMGKVGSHHSDFLEQLEDYNKTLAIFDVKSKYAGISLQEIEDKARKLAEESDRKRTSRITAYGSGSTVVIILILIFTGYLIRKRCANRTPSRQGPPVRVLPTSSGPALELVELKPEVPSLPPPSYVGLRQTTIF